MESTPKKTFAHRLSFAVAAAWLLITITIPMQAQYRGSLQGTVTDPQGGVVQNATVTLTSTETNNPKTATTSSSGVYSIPGLAPGSYSLVVEGSGFAKQALLVSITSEQAQSQDVHLEVAQPATTTVTVSAEAAPVIDTESATISGTLSAKQLQALPTFGRDPFQAAELAPGTFGDNARGSNGSGSQSLPGSAGPGAPSGTTSVFQTENQVQIVANGTRNNSNSFQVDGIEVNSLAWGGAAVITPNKESVKEVTVQSSPYSAENGRNSGAQVMVVSKNGTNEFHGSAVFKADRPGLNAYQRWNGPSGIPVERDNDRFNQWAGSIGGPILKNHLFFFFSYETLRNSSATLATGWYETPQFLASAAAPGSIASKITGYPGEGASFNLIIPKSCSDAGLPNPAQCRAIFNGGTYAGLDIGSPLKTPLGTSDPTFQNGGTPGVGGGLDGVPDLIFVQSVAPFSTAPQQFNGRMDFQATSKDLIAFSEYYVPSPTDSLNGPARAANFYHSDRLNETATLLWDHTISPSWLNEARGGVTRWYFNEVATNPQEPWGLPQDNVDAFGNLGSQGGFQFFGAPGPGVFYQTTYNLRDTASTSFGKHSMKIGADLYWEQDNDAEAFAARPQYNFRNLWDFANDAPYSESGNFDPKTGQPTAASKYIRSHIYAGFIQDDYKAKPNLTLNLGLRWEYFSPVREKYGNISNVLLGSGPDPLLGLRLKVGGDLYNASKNNWGPVFGFAWRPNPDSEKFVIRGGFGIGYNRMEEAITLNGRANPPLLSSLNLFPPQILYAVPGNVHQFTGWPINPAAIQAFDPTTTLPLTGAPVQITGFPINLPTPLVYRYSLDTEYDLGGNWVAKLGYQASLSRHYTRQVNLNWFYTATSSTALPSGAPIPFLNPRVQALTLYENDANSSYNAMLAELEHRFSRSFQIDFQYRWSHTIDDGSNDYYTGEYPFGLQYLKGDADFDVRHNVKLYGVWTPTLFGGHGWVDKILGGWQISGILNWHTGYPWTPIYSNTSGNVVYPNSGYNNLRPDNYLGGAASDSSNSTFMKPNGNFPNGALAYFTVPTFPALGIPPAPSVGRNVERGPHYFDTDLTLQKSFSLPKLPIFGENARFEFRSDFFNIFNKLNLALPNAVISTNGTTSNPLFGQSQSALAGRIVELQARFSF